jgi:TRAP-type C4-dicarboxylate transport system permease small subunit
MKRFFSRFVDGSVKVLESLITVLLVIMMLTLLWQVFTRFVVKVPSIWTEEVARAAFVYMALLGAAVGVRRFNHFGVSIFIDHLRGAVRDRYFRFVLNGLVLAAAVLVFAFGFDFTLKYGFTRVSPTFLIPMAWLFASVPLSGFFMSVFALHNLLFEDYSAAHGLAEE